MIANKNKRIIRKYSLNQKNQIESNMHLLIKFNKTKTCTMIALYKHLNKVLIFFFKLPKAHIF